MAPEIMNARVTREELIDLIQSHCPDRKKLIQAMDDSKVAGKQCRAWKVSTIFKQWQRVYMQYRLVYWGSSLCFVLEYVYERETDWVPAYEVLWDFIISQVGESPNNVVEMVTTR